MDSLDDLVDSVTEYQDADEEFYEERLERYDGDRSHWATAIDTAAYDVVDGVAIGSTNSSRDIGGTIGKADFSKATGSFYVEGLRALVDGQTRIEDALKQYEDEDVGRLVLKLTELRVRLQSATAEQLTPDALSKTLEALVEKLTTKEVESGALRQPLRETEAVVDMLIQLLSDSTAEEYTDVLVDQLSDAAGNESILQLVDEPQLTTPLWEHQEEALTNWVANGRRGYVDMATATGKTVLGLAAIAQHFEGLHPANATDQLSPDSPSRLDADLDVLIVAGRNLLLDQWRGEFETHMNVPKHRTKVRDAGNGQKIDLSWGTVEFQTSQQLANDDVLGRYDIVILDEAHRYSKGSSSNRGWRDVFDQLTEKSDAILAMSGSIDAGWIGDDTVETVIEDRLEEVYTFTLAEAKSRGVVADFSWNVSYVPAAEDDSLHHLVDVTETCTDFFGPPAGPDLSSLDEIVEEAGVWTLEDLRAFANTTEGRELRNHSERFDTLANAAFSRSTRRWQLGPSVDTIVDILRSHRDEQSVVLVQSYAFADEVSSAIAERVDGVEVAGLTSRSDDPMNAIEEFNEGRISTLVGPGDLLGTGVDLPDAEVAVNVGKGGLNASLVQRIGRVLRNPSGDKNATFYHLVSLPTDPRAVIGVEDGRRFLERICSFASLGDRMEELPSFECRDPSLSETLETLETEGVASFQELPHDVPELVDSTEIAEAVDTLCSTVRSSDAKVTSFEWAGQGTEEDEREGGFTEQTEQSDEDGSDSEMTLDVESDETDLESEHVERINDVAAREPIPDDELIALWNLDSTVELAQILKGRLDDYLTRDEAGEVCTTEMGRQIAGSESARKVDGEGPPPDDSAGTDTDESEGDSDETEADDPDRERSENEDRVPSVGASIESSPDDFVQGVQSAFGVDQTTSQRILDLYVSEDPVDVSKLTEGWGFDEAPDVYRYVNGSMNGLARVVGMGEVKLSPDARDRIAEIEDEVRAASSDGTAEDGPEKGDEGEVTGGVPGESAETRDSSERPSGADDGEEIPDHYSERLLETDREKLVAELQDSSDHALYPPTEETVVSESRYPFGSYIYTFGSFEDALRAAGYRIEDDPLTDNPDSDFRPSEVVAVVQVLADLFGAPPSELAFSEVSPMETRDTEMLGTWSQIVVESGLERKQLPDVDVANDSADPDGVSDMVVEFVAGADRSPSLSEIAEYCDLSVSQVVERVDSWQRVVELAARSPSNNADTTSSIGASSRATHRFEEAITETNLEVHPTIGVLSVLPKTEVASVVDSVQEYDLPEFSAGDDGGESENADRSETDHHDKEGGGADEPIVVEDRVRPEFEFDRKVALEDDLRRLAREFDHPPRPVDVKKYGRYSPAEYLDEMGSWDEVLDSVNLEFGEAWTRPEDHDEKLLQALEELADRIGHRPTTRTVDELTDYSATTYVSRFGSMTAALRATELDAGYPEWARSIVDTVSQSWEPLGAFEDVSDRERAGIEALLLFKRGWQGTGHETVQQVTERLDVDKPSYRNAWKKTIRPVLQEAEDHGLVRQNEGTWIWEWCGPDEDRP